MTTKTIDNRIKELEQEKFELESSFNKLQQEFNQTVSEKTTRFSQLEGALTELVSLKNQLNGQMIALETDRTS